MYRLGPMLAVVLLFGCTQAAKVGVEEEQSAQTSLDFGRLNLILAGIPKSADLGLYEGLPGAFWDPQLREQELARKKTTKFHGYPFYEELLTLKGPDAEPLNTLLAAKNSFSRYRGRKDCGGYYPEYCLQWQTGEATTRVLISLECGEVKLFGPKGELLCDLSADAHKKLKQLLAPFQKQRPTSESGRSG